MAGRAERPEPVWAQKVLALVAQGQQVASRQPEARQPVLERQTEWMVQRA
jgi:hypothetical protein